MADTVVSSTPAEMLASGRRHLAVRDYRSAVEALEKACEDLGKEYGQSADQCAEAYLWYGKALLGLSREESGVLGDGVAGPDAGEEKDEESEEEDENGDDQENGDVKENSDEQENGKKVEEADSKDEEMNKEEPTSSTDKTNGDASDAPGPSNGDVNDDSVVDINDEADIENIQLAWEMLELSRSILTKRLSQSSDAKGVKALLADVHLALGEVALESETYDKAVEDMQTCLDLQKELYGNDDRRIAETHYQIGLANSLSSSFEEAITHFKNAANIVETRIKTLENPSAAKEDATVKKYIAADPTYSIEGEIKELKELLPEIQEKIQDMMEYKAETIKRVRETLCPSNGSGSSSSTANGAGSSQSRPAADISHLVKRKRKSSENVDSSEASAPKRSNT